MEDGKNIFDESLKVNMDELNKEYEKHQKEEKGRQARLEIEPKLLKFLLSSEKEEYRELFDTILESYTWSDKSEMCINIERENHLNVGLVKDSSELKPEDREIYDILRESMRKDTLKQAQEAGFNTIEEWQEHNNKMADSKSRE